MSFWRQMTHGLRGLMHRNDRDREIDDEVQHYFEETTAVYRERGLSDEDARRAARRECGNLHTAKEQVRTYGWENTVRVFAADLRFAGRQLGRNPVFAITAILMLGIGIGANTAIFTFVNSVLLRPLPYPDSNRLAVILSELGNSSRAPASMFELYQMRQRSHAFTQIAGIWVTNRALPGKGDPEQGKAGVVTSNFLQLFSTRPMLGRFFGPEDDLENAPSTVVLSHQLWVRKFGSDPRIIGTSVPLGHGSSIVIGVLPQNFRLIFPEDASVPPNVDYFQSTPIGPWEPNGPGFLHLVGRLSSIESLPAAQRELASIATEINNIGARTKVANYHLYAFSLQDDDVREVRRTLYLLFAAVAFILLIGCANVANLLMIRARQRIHETTIRAALGASTFRLIQQILTETLVTVLLGGVVALLLGWAALKAIVAVEPSSFANLGHVSLDLRVLAFTFVIALLISAIVALAPISIVCHLKLAEDLKRSGRSTTRRQSRSTTVLVATEVALAFVLLIGTGLLVRTFANILRVDPGFRADNVFTLRASVPNYDVLREVQRALTALPGVRSVSTVSHLPLDDQGNWYDYYWKDGSPVDQQNIEMADMRSILPGYFDTIGAQLMQGRDFTESDDVAHQHVAVIDEILAHRLWPGESPLGKRINASDSPKGPYQFERDWLVVVGVVRHVQCHTLTATVRPQIYVHYPLAPRPSMSLVIRTGGTVPDLASSVRKQIAALNRNVPITHLEPLSSVVERARAESRFVSVLATLLSIVALQLALGGIYGVLSYSVVLRTAEIGIRMAVGAQRAEIMRLVFAAGFLPVALGIVAGAILSAVSMPLLDHLLFEIKPSSPEVYLLSIIAIFALSGVAMLVPALRAIKIDPLTALACE
jgi:putative ABC transport system permease protein